MQEIELCLDCEELTGKAGKDDDSLYLEDGTGPFCEACFEAAQLRLHLTIVSSEEKEKYDREIRTS